MYDALVAAVDTEEEEVVKSSSSSLSTSAQPVFLGLGANGVTGVETPLIAFWQQTHKERLGVVLWPLGLQKRKPWAFVSENQRVLFV